MNLDALVERYGSPLYVYELGELRAAHTALRAALPPESELFYSLKANPHPEVVRALAALGCVGEVSSPGELRVAQAAGCAPPAMLYTGPGKSRAELQGALRAGVRRFSVDSPAQLRRLGEVAVAMEVEAEVALRVNPTKAGGGFGLAMGGGASPFGADAAWVTSRASEFQPGPGARLVGFHFYVGTNAHDVEALARTFEDAIVTSAALAKALAFTPSFLDLGGGFGHPFAASGARVELGGLRERLEPLLDATWPGWRGGAPRIAFESGRYLVASAGTLVCTVEDVKVSDGRRFVVLDSGVHHLGGLGGLRKIAPGTVRIERLHPREPLEVDATDVVGPLCTPADFWARGAALPRLEIGERLVVRNVGAYGLSASLLAFLSRDVPAEVVIDGERVSASQVSLVRGPVSGEQR